MWPNFLKFYQSCFSWTKYVLSRVSDQNVQYLYVEKNEEVLPLAESVVKDSKLKDCYVQ